MRLFSFLIQKPNYTSPADQFLTAFNKRTPLSASQKAEYAKNQKVAQARDQKK